MTVALHHQRRHTFIVFTKHRGHHACSRLDAIHLIEHTKLGHVLQPILFVRLGFAETHPLAEPTVPLEAKRQVVHRRNIATALEVNRQQFVNGRVFVASL